MNILHLYKDYHPILGGIENHIKMLAEAQAAAGNQVTVLVTDPDRLPGRETIHGVQVIRTRRWATVASTPLTLGFVPILARASQDMIHLHFPYPVGEISQWLAGRGRPYVITYHSDVVRGSQQAFLRLYRPLLWNVLRRAAAILVTSREYAASSPFLAKLAGKVKLAPLGVDPAPFLEAVPLIPHRGRPVLLFVGRHRYYKGVDDLIRALPETGADLLVGGDGPRRSEWERLAGGLGLGERVRFLGDVPAADLPGLYASADVFVLPANARAEAFGTVLLEAMASGLPCITTRLGTGTSYVVQDGLTGLVVPPHDPPALAGAINRLLADPALARRMGAAGRERVLQEFTLEKMVARVDQIYRELLTDRSS
ncbi:MAG TPA: glycosyltransferase [Anaerolineales bacterium]